MNLIANTPEPPYYAVIFSNHRTQLDDEGYGKVAVRMMELVAQQSGFLGVESVREDLGITISYWRDLQSIKAWKANAEHVQAQQLGHKKWYSSFKTRIAKVERDYGI